MEFEEHDPTIIEEAIKCGCGAITVNIEGENYSMRPSTFMKVFRKYPPRKVRWGMCNHCINKWGLELCACGSGEHYDTCNNKIEGYCGKPMQIINVRTHV